MSALFLPVLLYCFLALLALTVSFFCVPFRVDDLCFSSVRALVANLQRSLVLFLSLCAVTLRSLCVCLYMLGLYFRFLFFQQYAFSIVDVCVASFAYLFISAERLPIYQQRRLCLLNAQTIARRRSGWTRMSCPRQSHFGLRNAGR